MADAHLKRRTSRVGSLLSLGSLIGLIFVGCKKKDEPYTTTVTVAPPSAQCTQNVSDVKTQLASLRAAVVAFHADVRQGGDYPGFLNELVPNYIAAIPSITICNASNVIVHSPSNAVDDAPDFRVTNVGGWIYINNPATSSNDYTHIYVNSSGTSSEGTLWINY